MMNNFPVSFLTLQWLMVPLKKYAHPYTFVKSELTENLFTQLSYDIFGAFPPAK